MTAADAVSEWADVNLCAQLRGAVAIQAFRPYPSWTDSPHFVDFRITAADRIDALRAELAALKARHAELVEELAGADALDDMRIETIRRCASHATELKSELDALKARRCERLVSDVSSTW